MLICWAHFYGHSITVVWGLETVAKEVAEGVWKLLLTHCPCLRPGGGAASEAWTSPELPCSWKQRFRPSLLNCQFEAWRAISLAVSIIQFWEDAELVLKAQLAYGRMGKQAAIS